MRYLLTEKGSRTCGSTEGYWTFGRCSKGSRVSSCLRKCSLLQGQSLKNKKKKIEKGDAEFSFFSLHVFKMSSKKIRVLKATLEMVAVVLNALCCLLCLLLLGSSRSLTLAACFCQMGVGAPPGYAESRGEFTGVTSEGWGCPPELLLLPAATGGVLQREGALSALGFATHLCSAGRKLGGWRRMMCPRGV